MLPLPKPAMFRAVLFDLDNTLVDRDRAFRACVNAQFRDLAVCTELLQLDHRGRGDRDALFNLWEKHAGTRKNQTVIERLIAERIQPDRRLLDALRVLSKTMKLGIITNGSGEAQRWKFFAAGLEEVISPDRVWVSAEVGLAKPNPAIFLLAAQSLGETPEHCLYIGDHEQDDLLGATNAGLRACLVDGVLDAERLEQLLRRERIR